MPENEVTIHVGGDLSQLEGDAKKLGSALDGEARAGFMAGMTVPEFQLGGLVSNQNGGILALLHPGEFVMRQAAVDALGANFLAGLNRTPRFDTGGAVGRGVSPAGGGQRTYNQTFNLYQLPGESQRTFAMRVAVAVRRATADGAL